MGSNEIIEALEGRHYDVGLFGMWFGENYGSTLTYYALREAIMELGYSVLMIDKPILAEKDDEHDQSIHPRVFARENGYEVSPPLKPENMRALNRYCDTFMVGSDQVWNFEIARYFRLLSYLPFVSEGNKRLSYAASFGHGSSLTPRESLSKVASYFNRFDAISVRESIGVDILRREFGVTGTQVVDPIYLHNRSLYDQIAQPPEEGEIGDGYLLSYILDPTPKIGRVVRDAAKRMGLKPLVLLDGRGDLEANKELMGISDAFRCADVHRWLYYIKNAEFMITDSFHGASFALLFHRRVLILGNNRGQSRIQTLVGTYRMHGIFAHNVDELASIAKNPPDFDFNEFEDILSMERRRSWDWLKAALALKKSPSNTVQCVTAKECCGCAACYSACPTQAIEMTPDSEGFLYPQIDKGACIDCGKCKRACPSLNPRLEKLSRPLCYAAYTKRQVREKSSSGGLFSLVAEQVLAQGGIVCGAAFDSDFHLSQTWATSEAELEPLRMSKYMQSETGDTFREAKDALEQGVPVLYVGCPCQVAGLNAYLGKSYSGLFTIDLLCHGGPSQKVFKRYLDEVHGGREITYVGFRDKEYFGWSHEMTVKYADGEIYRELSKKDLFYRTFTPCLSVRPHCQVCNYSRLPRQGDLTLGDFWGVGKYDKGLTDGRGTSIVSVNSKSGMNMLTSLWDSLDVLDTLPREHILTHGQPFARPFRNNQMRSRFHRMLEDYSLEKALECCEKNIFDFALLGAHGDTYGDVLRTYALQRVLAQVGRSVLVVQRPEEAKRAISPTAYRFIEFANKHYPAFSAHKTELSHRELKHYCRGFVMDSGSRDYPGPAITGDKLVVSYSQDSAEALVNPILLLSQDDLARLLVSSHARVGNPVPAHYVVEKGFDAASFSGLRGAVDLTGDMAVDAWVQSIANARCVITDDEDVAAVALLLGTPLRLCATLSGSSVCEKFSMLGIAINFVSNDKDFDDFLRNPVPNEIGGLESAIADCRLKFVSDSENAMGDLVPRPQKSSGEGRLREREKKARKLGPRKLLKGAKRVVRRIYRG